METGGKGSVMRLNRKFLMVFAPGIALSALVLAVVFNHEISSERERARVAEQGLELATLTGGEISDEDWSRFYRFYQLTYAKRSGHGGYLTRDFFLETAPGLGDQVVMTVARHGGTAVAGALYFRSRDTLYGRYWGCQSEFDCLHFEACYYQGIEYCIKHGLSRFDPGAQGEHKIQRGFRPVSTWSNHWPMHSPLLLPGMKTLKTLRKPRSRLKKR